MKLIIVLICAVALVGCISDGPRAGGDGASRSNGNTNVTINQYQYGGKEQPSTHAAQTVTVHIKDNIATQDAQKSVDAGKAAANVAATGQGQADASGNPTVEAVKAEPVKAEPVKAEPVTDGVIVVEETTTVLEKKD